ERFVVLVLGAQHVKQPLRICHEQETKRCRQSGILVLFNGKSGPAWRRVRRTAEDRIRWNFMTDNLLLEDVMNRKQKSKSTDSKGVSLYSMGGLARCG